MPPPENLSRFHPLTPSLPGSVVRHRRSTPGFCHSSHHLGMHWPLYLHVSPPRPKRTEPVEQRKFTAVSWRKDGITEGHTCPLWAAPQVPFNWHLSLKLFLWDAVKGRVSFCLPHPSSCLHQIYVSLTLRLTILFTFAWSRTLGIPESAALAALGFPPFHTPSTGQGFLSQKAGPDS